MKNVINKAKELAITKAQKENIKAAKDLIVLIIKYSLKNIEDRYYIIYNILTSLNCIDKKLKYNLCTYIISNIFNNAIEEKNTITKLNNIKNPRANKITSFINNYSNYSNYTKDQQKIKKRKKNTTD